MASPRPPVEPTPGRRRQPASLPLPPGVDSRTSVRDLLLRSWAGRLFIIATLLKLIVAALRSLGELPAFVQILSSAATIGLAISIVYFVGRLVALVNLRLLWRVRRKLILSYIFIGVVPALLLVFFFVLGAWVLSLNLSAYLFKDGYEDVVKNAALLADAAAAEIARKPETARETIERVQRNGSRSLRYPNLSIVFVPVGKSDIGIVSAGPWDHIEQPVAAPEWVQKVSAFAGTLALVPPERGGDAELIVRAAKPVESGARRIGYVIADIPIDSEVLDRLYDVTSIRAGSVRISTDEASALMPPGSVASTTASGGSQSLFRQSVTFLDVTDWPTGTLRRATVSMTFKPGDLYGRLARAQNTQLGPVTMAQGIFLALMAVAVLFLVIEIIALIMGLALARSITSSIHQLFMGTERVRQGDFTHRIDIRTKDQLGELADSFNQMTGSIENLLQTAAEKKRLEEELRIARQIQMSLLPRGPLDVPGLAVTALCVPAREVGGDYYDFFPLADARLGVLIADVAGKGTSAALYMAELKGLVLSLSQIYQSPRQLLIEVNRILSENLDSRSFITMTYAVLDLAGGTMTYARAGHTPLIFVPSPATSTVAQVLTPSGMVLGLRIDGAAEKFAELLEEQRVTLHAGAIIVLYTDGITEAMNAESDLFGESRLSRIVEEHGHLDSGELRERILREIEAFVGNADQHDDMTMILMKVDRAVAEKVAV
ncbi:MAG TPA: PP2C family protein-serine/threonine phosphatase [Vicinamibacterales bacterium]|nr:PP2C family protein-serine/threonine phosphatase [Vicinamibacterales bacterium]